MPADANASSPDTAALIEARDWATTELGDRAGWPQGLTSAIEQAQDSSLATVIWWGGGLTQFYNDAAIELMGSRHPAVFGSPAAGFQDANWTELEGLANSVMSSGRPERCRLQHPGSYPRVLTWCAGALRDSDGAIAGVAFTVVELEGLATSTDIDDLRSLQERQRLLLAELQHRVKNILAVIRSIARRTAENSRSVADFVAHFDGRINALARTQGLLTRDPSAGVKLDYLVAEELSACGAKESDGSGKGVAVTIRGPDVRLRAKAAEMFALAIHELATNAVKHGALASVAGAGSLKVEWRLTDGEPPQLIFAWRETLTQPARRPSKRRGFGREFIEQTLRYELDAVSTITLDASGLLCEIVIPLTERVWIDPAG